LPDIVTQPQSQVFCKDEGDIALSVSATPGGGRTLSYQWKTGAGTGSDVGTNSPAYSATVKASTNYWVVVTDNHNCSVTSMRASITVSSSGGTIGPARVCEQAVPGKIGVL
jgi:hypothetical protein